MAEVPLPTPTDNPVPSTDIRDAVYAGAMLDKVVTSTDLTYTDRLGGEHYTVDGIKAEGDKVVDETRQNLIPLSRQYMTLAAAQADIANIPVGSTTYVRSQDGSALADEYINNGGTLEATGRSMPSQQSIEELQQLIQNDPSVEPFVQWEGDGGFIVAKLDKSALKTAGFEVGEDLISMSAMNVEKITEAESVVQDEYGFIFERRTSEYFETAAGRFISVDNNDYVIEDEHGFQLFSVMNQKKRRPGHIRHRAKGVYC